MGSETSTLHLDDRTFRLFLHDVHHAYLLLRRAFLHFPPTVIFLRSRWNPCHSPAMTISTNHHTFNLIRQLLLLTLTSRLPSDQEEDNDMFELAKGPQPLAHLAPQAKFPSPFRRVPAPDASALPMPSTMPTKSPILSSRTYSSISSLYQSNLGRTRNWLIAAPLALDPLWPHLDPGRMSTLSV